jgi:hypothetical protein
MADGGRHLVFWIRGMREEFKSAQILKHTSNPIVKIDDVAWWMIDGADIRGMNGDVRWKDDADWWSIRREKLYVECATLMQQRPIDNWPAQAAARLLYSAAGHDLAALGCRLAAAPRWTKSHNVCFNALRTFPACFAKLCPLLRYSPPKVGTFLEGLQTF